MVRCIKFNEYLNQTIGHKPGCLPGQKINKPLLIKNFQRQDALLLVLVI